MSEPDLFRIRENALDWAVRSSGIGDDALQVLARAQLYAEFVLGTEGAARKLAYDGGNVGVEIV